MKETNQQQVLKKCRKFHFNLSHQQEAAVYESGWLIKGKKKESLSSLLDVRLLQRRGEQQADTGKCLSAYCYKTHSQIYMQDCNPFGIHNVCTFAHMYRQVYPH